MKINNKYFFLLILCSIFIFNIFCGCIGGDTSNISDEITDVKIEGLNVIRTVDYPEENIRLIVNGLGCYITVTKETNLVEVIISEIDNIVEVSRSHTFNSTVVSGSKIQFYD